MRRYFVAEIYESALHRAGKHRQDVEQTLAAMGFIKINVQEGGGFWGKVKPYVQAFRWFAKIEKGSLVHFHFPMPSRAKRFFKLLLAFKGVHTIVFTFDVEGLRSGNTALLKQEVNLLQSFSFILTQNECMEAKLQASGIGANIDSLPFIDHIGIFKKFGAHKNGKGICFAGNLDKASFLQKAQSLPDLQFFIYGEGCLALPLAANISYEGVVHPEALPLCIKGNYGLVWDGPDLDGCNAPHGNYLQHNTPFKAATYIMGGLPLIVSEGSALACWVACNKTGIVVDSLFTLSARIEQVSEEEYTLMCQNLRFWQEQMGKGSFYKTAIERVVTGINEKGGLI